MTITEHHDVFSSMCKLISRGDKENIFAFIPNKPAKDFIQACLMDDPDDRPTVSSLMTHKFFSESPEDDDDLKTFKVSTEFIPM